MQHNEANKLAEDSNYAIFSRLQQAFLADCLDDPSMQVSTSIKPS